MSAPTPGPWFVSELDGGTYLYAICDHSPRGKVRSIARVGGFGDGSRKANARLIAAAPSLLAALQMLHDVCVGMDLEDERERPTEQKYQAAIALSEHALASATGVQA